MKIVNFVYRQKIKSYRILTFQVLILWINFLNDERLSVFI